MPLILPPARNYPIGRVSVPARLAVPPKEGPRMIQGEITWSSANTCFNVEVQDNATQPFSQIIAISVDNSQSGADVTFYFPDTQETTTIPAYSPKVIVEVFTNQKVFYMIALGTVLSTDVTRFTVHNYLPPPIAVPVTLQQNNAAVGPVDFGTASTQLIPTSINGTLENAWFWMGLNAGASGTGTWSLQDNTSKVFASGAIETSSGDKYNIALLNLTGAHLRFSGGLKLICTQSAALTAKIYTNLYYRTP